MGVRDGQFEIDDVYDLGGHAPKGRAEWRGMAQHCGDDALPDGENEAVVLDALKARVPLIIEMYSKGADGWRCGAAQW